MVRVRLHKKLQFPAINNTFPSLPRPQLTYNPRGIFQTVCTLDTIRTVWTSVTIAAHTESYDAGPTKNKAVLRCPRHPGGWGDGGGVWMVDNWHRDGGWWAQVPKKQFNLNDDGTTWHLWISYLLTQGSWDWGVSQISTSRILHSGQNLRWTGFLY